MSKEEWKTMRVAAVSYYKLVDLGNLLSLILGRKLAVSDVFAVFISEYYPVAYANMATLVANPEKLEKARKEIGGQIERLEKLWKERK